MNDQRFVMLFGELNLGVENVDLYRQWRGYCFIQAAFAYADHVSVIKALFPCGKRPGFIDKPRVYAQGIKTGIGVSRSPIRQINAENLQILRCR